MAKGLGIHNAQQVAWRSILDGAECTELRTFHWEVLLKGASLVGPNLTEDSTVFEMRLGTL